MRFPVSRARRLGHNGAMRAAACLAVVIACAVPLPAAAKPKGCLTAGEMVTEQLVRHGVFLREASRLCDDTDPGAAKLWKDFDTTFDAQLSAQTARRKTVFQREFPKTSLQMMTYFDGRMVTNYRYNHPTNGPFCKDVMTLLQKNQRGGWGSFTRQAKVIQDNVRLDFKLCGF
jgi:hypothetical protein